MGVNKVNNKRKCKLISQEKTCLFVDNLEEKYCTFQIIFTQEKQTK